MSWNSVSFVSSATSFSDPTTRSSAEVSYAKGCELQAIGSPESVDCFADAAQRSWAPSLSHVQGQSDSLRQKQLYDSAVGRLVETAQQFGKFDPIRGVLLENGATITVNYKGVDWQPTEINRIEIVGEYETPDVQN